MVALRVRATCWSAQEDQQEWRLTSLARTSSNSLRLPHTLVPALCPPTVQTGALLLPVGTRCSPLFSIAATVSTIAPSATFLAVPAAIALSSLSQLPPIEAGAPKLVAMGSALRLLQNILRR